MDRADLDLFMGSLRRATERYTGETLDAALEQLGWRDALPTDERDAVSTLFELQGSANATSSGLDSVLRHGLTAGLGLGLALEGSVVLPALGACDPPGQQHGQRLSVCGLGSAALARAERVTVVARSGEADLAFEVSTTELAIRPRRGVDPSLGLVEVNGHAAVEPSETVVAWEDAVALGQLALGHELVGAAKAMLDLARAHALQRIQFGRPIATFQAIRHRLAETLVAIESADALLSAAWDHPSAGAAAMAKAVAGRSARVASRHCQQVLAGIGFTTEHPFHRHLRRCMVLDQLLGGSRTLTKELGTEVLRTRRLPPPLPL